MGGYPSHDAPNFLFATAAQNAGDGGTTEVCLVPLLRRYFNDSNKRLKDAVAQLYFKGPPNTTAIAMQALQNNISSHCASADLSAHASIHSVGNLSSTIIPPGAAPSPAHALNASMSGCASSDPSSETTRRAVNAYKSMDQLLSEIEASFLTTTRALYDSVGEANAKVQEKRASSIKTAEKGKNQKSAPSACGAAKEDPVAPRGVGNSSRPSVPSQQSTSPSAPPVLRPVPCAVCVIEPDTSGRRGSSSQPHANSPSGIQNNALNALSVPAPTAGPNGLQLPNYSSVGAPSTPEWITLQGRRLRCVGYLSCFSKPRPVESEPKDMFGSESRPPLHVLRINDCGSKGLDVALDLVFEDEVKYTHLLEPVVFLASIMFRSQYLTSSMLQRPVHSPEVENAYYAHLQLLNVHMRLTKDQVHQLKVLQEQLPLIDFVEEMGLSERHPTPGPGGETASCGGGAASLDATLSVGETLPEIIQPLASDGEAPTKAESATSNPTGVSDSSEVAKLRQSIRDDDDAEKEEHLDDDDGEKNGAPQLPTEELPTDKAAKKTEEGENEEGETAESARNTTVEWDKDVKPNASLSTSSRRTRRSRRRQRKQKTAEPQDEIYRKTHCTMPSVSLYELSSGERGLEAIFDGALLARMMKLIAETAAYETVKNSFVRCDMGPLMKERRHLNQSRREALQEEGSVEREEERVMGSTLVAAAVRTWVKEGLAAEEEKQKRGEAAAELPQAAAAAASVAQNNMPTLLPPQLPQMMHATAMMHPNVVQGNVSSMMAGTAAPPGMVNPIIAAQAAAMGQNASMMRMGVVSSGQPPPAAAPAQGAPAGAPLFMYVPGFGYVPVPSNSRVMTAPAPQTQAAHPTYVINPATGQPMMLATPTPPAGSTNASAVPQQQQQMMAFPSVMQMYNAPQQQQQQQQQQVMASAPCFAPQGAPQALPQQPQQQAYQYMMSPNGQLLMVPVLSTPTPAPPPQQQQQQQQYMMAAMPPQQAHQMQSHQVYMNPYMLPGMMNPAAAHQQHAQQQAQQQHQQAQYHAQQQQQQADGQKVYQQLIDAQEEAQLLRQLQHQAQMAQQAPLNEQQQAQLLKQAQMVLQARRSQQAQLQQQQQQQVIQMAQQQQQAQQQAQHQAQQQQAAATNMAAGGSSQVLARSATGTPVNTPPHQGSAAAPSAAYNAAPGSSMPPPPHPHMQGIHHSSMYAHLQQQSPSTGSTVVNEGSSTGAVPSVPSISGISTSANAGPVSAGTIGDHSATLAAVDFRTKPNPYHFAAINDDDDDDDPSVDLVAAMGNIRGHSDMDHDDDDDGGGGGGRFYANSQFFF